MQYLRQGIWFKLKHDGVECYITINKLCVIELYKSIHIIRSTYVYLQRVFFVISIEHAFYSILQFSCARRRYKITILHHCSVSLSPFATFSFFPIGLHNYTRTSNTQLFY